MTQGIAFFDFDDTLARGVQRLRLTQAARLGMTDLLEHRELTLAVRLILLI